MEATTRVVVRALTWPLTPVLLVASGVVLLQRPASSHPLLTPADLPFVVATVACWLVGVVLTARAVDQRAGWAFLGLGTVLAWSDLAEIYAELALTRRPELPAGALAATLSDTSFVWWFVFLALILQFTPPGPPAFAFQRRLSAWTVGAGIVYQVASLLRSTRLDPPYEGSTSPWALESVPGLTATLAAVGIIVVGLCVVASVVGLTGVWRRAEGESRRQLLWLVAGALPLLPCVVASFAVSYAGRSDLAGYLMGAATLTLAIGAALSVLRYRLYDVERVVTDSAAYALASATVVLGFVVVVVVVSQTTPISAGSQLPTILATLAAVTLARTTYLWARRTAQRRINRTQFDAVAAVRAGLGAATPDLDAIVTAALNDPAARVLYPAEGGTWVTSNGRDARVEREVVDVRRRGSVTARIEFDGSVCDRSLVEAVAGEVAAEIDNVALRAELARQVALISDSRSRLATAHLEERRRIERDLHDGAQQRLLAIALQLQSARVNGESSVLRDEVDRAVVQLGWTVQELRDLAGGLQPAALAGGGLLAAVVDLVNRIPLAVSYDVVEERFPASIEGAAWFVIAEAVANVVKHAHVDDVSISVTAEDSVLQVRISDRGIGHADPRGTGLQGLADRVSALHGSLCVTENRPHGTTIRAELPCAS